MGVRMSGWGVLGEKPVAPGPFLNSLNRPKWPNFGRGARVLRAIAPELLSPFPVSMAHLNRTDNDNVFRPLFWVSDSCTKR